MTNNRVSDQVLKRKFKGIEESPVAGEIRERLLKKDESPKDVSADLKQRGYEICPSYLYQYRQKLLSELKTRADGIIAKLEADGILPYINEISFLKAIIANAFNNEAAVKNATLKDAIEAAKILLSAKVHLTKRETDKMKGFMDKYSTGDADDAEFSDAPETDDTPVLGSEFEE